MKSLNFKSSAHSSSDIGIGIGFGEFCKDDTTAGGNNILEGDIAVDVIEVNDVLKFDNMFEGDDEFDDIFEGDDEFDDFFEEDDEFDGIFEGDEVGGTFEVHTHFFDILQN